MSAKLAGAQLLPGGSIAAAATKSGKQELANPSCPADSLVGDVTIKAGSGADPFTDDRARPTSPAPTKARR